MMTRRPRITACWTQSVSDEVKACLKQQYATLNPVALKRELTRLTEHLLRLPGSKSAPPTRPSNR